MTPVSLGLTKILYLNLIYETTVLNLVWSRQKKNEFIFYPLIFFSLPFISFFIGYFLIRTKNVQKYITNISFVLGVKNYLYFFLKKCKIFLKKM